MKNLLPLPLRMITSMALAVFFPPCPVPAQVTPLPTSGPVVVEPLPVPTGAVGWAREYSQVVEETFSTPSRVPALGFALEQGGRYVRDANGEFWVQGSSAGELMGEPRNKPHYLHGPFGIVSGRRGRVRAAIRLSHRGKNQ